MRARRIVIAGGNQAGSSLVEVLIAALIMVTGVVAMVRLIATAVERNVDARSRTMATLLAMQKIEQLRSLVWTIDPSGAVIEDTSTDTSTVPESSAGTGLQMSPPGALSGNTPGFVDHLDATGAIVGRGTQPPAHATYTRRWSIDPAVVNGALVLQVRVVRKNARDERLGRDIRVATVKARKRL
jgi:type II secretory pathway pseudopilin PulG